MHTSVRLSSSRSSTHCFSPIYNTLAHRAPTSHSTRPRPAADCSRHAATDLDTHVYTQSGPADIESDTDANLDSRADFNGGAGLRWLQRDR